MANSERFDNRNNDCACPTSSRAVITNPDCACPNAGSSRLSFQEDCAMPPLAQLENTDIKIGDFLTMSQTYQGLAVIIHLAN